MSSEVCVAVIHGIGSQNATFADDMIEEVQSKLGGLSARVKWQPIHWAPKLQPQEADLITRLGAGPGGRLDYKFFRQLIIHFLADAVAYQRLPDEAAPGGVYFEIHKLISEQLAALRGKVQRGAGDPPLLVVAHSLGGHIMSNYIWDRQRDNATNLQGADTAFVNAETLAGLITFGCNIPLFALALKDIIPIDFPGKSVGTKLAGVARWINLYDADDILGYPLAPLSEQYAEVVHDKAINAGGLLDSWNPASHNAYWTDNDVTDVIVKTLRELLEAA
jgi:pimeloyl-ACP methyl ester carboxylesterase